MRTIVPPANASNFDLHSFHTLPRRSFLRTAMAIGLWPLGLASASAMADAKTEALEELDAGSPHYWRRLRKQFSIPEDEGYFNTGTVGACPKPVLDAVVASMATMEKTLAQFDYVGDRIPIAGYESQDPLRAKCGRVLNASGHDVALTQNATMGINFIANGLDLRPGDEVLITDQEHPGAMCPWDLRAKREGIVVKRMPIPIPAVDADAIVQIFAKAVGPRTKVIAVPHITSRFGIVMPVVELCALARQHGLFTLIDGAQAPGQLSVDVKKIECDAYSCSPHKWLLAPPGNGLLYVKAERQNEIWTTLASTQWNNDAPQSGVFRLMQFGTANAALLAGLDAAIDFHLRIGAEKIEHHIIGLADRLRSGLQRIRRVVILSPTHPALAGAMVTYGIPGMTGPALQEQLWKRKKIRVREQGEYLVRQSVHYYNSPEEIDRTLEAVAALAKS